MSIIVFWLSNLGLLFVRRSWNISILIIGAGQLGSRHLQGISKNKVALDLHILDPFQESIDKALVRFREISTHKNHSLTTHMTFESLPNYFDLVVIATTADVRAEATMQLLDVCGVKRIIFEKVLFQKEADFTSVNDLLVSRKIEGYVNCPRRQWDLFKDLKSLISGRTFLMDVEGGGWGFACNSIHMVDLASFLGAGSDYEITFSSIEENMESSKRNGFYELNGRMVYSFIRGHKLSINCRKVKEPVKLTIRTSDFEVEVTEHAGVSTLKRSDHKPRFYKVPVQSELSQLYVGAETDKLELTSYEESKSLHIPMLREFSKSFPCNVGQTAWVCPIT